MAKLSVRDLDLKGKRVLVRVDFNVPLKDGQVADDTRIKASLPTILHILEKGGQPVLVSHLGRPDGKPNDKYSLKPVAARLQELLDRPVDFGEPQGGAVTLLENVRFDPGEEKNDDALAKKLASYGDVYVNDAFGTAHRAHASTAGVTKYFKQSACGFLIEKEIQYLGKVLTNPDLPFIAIMGGSKVSDKILILEQLARKVELDHRGRGHGLYPAQGPGDARGKLEGRGGQARPGEEDPRLGADHPAGRPRRGRQLRCGGEDAGRGRRARRLDGSRHRPQVGRALLQGALDRQDRALERPARRLRDGPLRARHAGDRRVPGRA